MSATVIDPFELLDVPRREDSYSSLLRQLLQDSPNLRERVLAHGFQKPCPVLTNVVVVLRRGLPDSAGIPDLLLEGEDAEGQRWELFIENKIDAGESPGQTQRYLDACRQRQRVPERAAGILLTLDGRRPQAESSVMALRHAELAGWVEECAPGSRGLCSSGHRRAARGPPRRDRRPLPSDAGGPATRERGGRRAGPSHRRRGSRLESQGAVDSRTRPRQLRASESRTTGFSATITTFTPSWNSWGRVLDA